jgi:Domain of unknown function DUF29
MEELNDLREHIVAGRTEDALNIVQELEDMNRKSVIMSIETYLARALMHLVKMDVEKKLTSSWRASVRESFLRIFKLNRMDNHTAYYIKMQDWEGMLDEAFAEAIFAASEEVLEGKYKPRELETLVDKPRLMRIMLALLTQTYSLKFIEFMNVVESYLIEEQQNTTL